MADGAHSSGQDLLRHCVDEERRLCLNRHGLFVSSPLRFATAALACAFLASPINLPNPGPTLLPIWTIVSPASLTLALGAGALAVIAAFVLHRKSREAGGGRAKAIPFPKTLKKAPGRPSA